MHSYNVSINQHVNGIFMGVYNKNSNSFKISKLKEPHIYFWDCVVFKIVFWLTRGERLRNDEGLYCYGAKKFSMIWWCCGVKILVWREERIEAQSMLLLDLIVANRNERDKDGNGNHGVVSMNLLQWLKERKFILQRLARCYEADDRWCIAWEMCVREEKMQWLLQLRKRKVDYGWELGFRKWERKKPFFFFVYIQVR